MKIQLDTTNKTIKVEEDVEIYRLVLNLKAMFPNGGWKKYTLQTNTTIVKWAEPIILPYIERQQWDRPWYAEYNGDGKNLTAMEAMSENSGTYNVEIK